MPLKISPIQQRDLAKREFARFDISKLKLATFPQHLAARVLLCGDRNWNNLVAIKRELKLCHSLIELGHGDCEGADEAGGKIAARLGFKVRPFTANWNLFGNPAGPIRNRQMLIEFRPQFVLAFHANLEKSKGTRDMVKAAESVGLRYKVISH